MMAQSAAFHLTKLSETPTDCMIYFYETRTTELKVKRVKSVHSIWNLRINTDIDQINFSSASIFFSS